MISMMARAFCLRVHATLNSLSLSLFLGMSKQKGDKERERERERERCIIWLFLFLKGMTGALAPFSYLVYYGHKKLYDTGPRELRG
jgi:hypothetical protein